MGRNLKTLATILSLSVVYGIYYWGIPAIINLPEHTNFIESEIYKKTKIKTEIRNPKLKMGITPSLWLSAENISILNADDTKALDIENVNFNIRLLPLIFKKTNIKHLSINNVDVNLVYDKDCHLKLGQYPINKIPKISLNRANINLKNFNIKLLDEFQNKKINLVGSHLDIADYQNNKQINFSTQAQLKIDNKISDINTNIHIKFPFNRLTENKLELSGYIKNLDLSDFSHYVSTFSNGGIKALSGVVNVSAQTNNTTDKQIKSEIKIKNLGILKDDLASSIHFKDALSIKSEINTLSNGIFIKNSEIYGNGINLKSSGTITNINNKIPNVDLKINITDSKTEKLLTLLPGEPDLTPDANLLLLKQTGLWGDISANLAIKGKADYPNINGKVSVKNAYLVKPIPNTDKATINLDFKGDKFELDVIVPTAKNQAVYVNGPINLDKERSAKLFIKSTDKIDLKTAQIILNPLHEILHFDIGPVPIMDLNGKGNIDLQVVGTRKDPHGIGEFNFQNTTVKFLDINNMTLANGTGVLKFDNQTTYFETKSAILNNTPIQINGTCTLLGDLDFNIIANNQDINALLKTVKTSPMLSDIQKLTQKIENGWGRADLTLNFTGQIKDVNNVIFNKNLFAKGSIKLLSDSFKIENFPQRLTQTNGTINFNNLDTDFALQTHFGNSKINIDGKIKDNIATLNAISNKFSLADVPLPIKDIDNHLGNINANFYAKYNGSIEDIDYNKISVIGKAFSNEKQKSSLTINDTYFELKNSNFKLTNLNGKYYSSPFNLDLNINNFFKNNRNINAYGKISDLDLRILNKKEIEKLLPPIKDISVIDGKITLTSRIRNNNTNIYTELEDIQLFYKPTKIKLTLNSGNVLLRNNDLNINKVTGLFGQMPIFIDGKIYNIYQNPNLNLYLNTKPTQEFFDQFFNKHALYPIKAKGDIILTSKFDGTINNLSTKTTLDIAENSNLYYMGATLGDSENPVKIILDNKYYADKIKINNFQYDKIILSQNNKPVINTQLNASGSVKLLDENKVEFENLKIKTQSPTDAKIFNIIFRKPFMKQGVFTSDLILNGTSYEPQILGKLDITSIDIPFFDSTIKDVNLDFKKSEISIKGRGTVLTNDITIDAIVKNNLIPPYTIEDLKIKLANFDVNKITETLRDFEAENVKNQNYKDTPQQFDTSQLIIQKAQIDADKISVRNINADDFTSTFSISKNKILDIDTFKFNIAEGSVLGNLKINLLDNMTNLDIHLNNANALIMSEALFDLKGQVYGSVNGDFNLVCDSTTTEKCFKTLSGKGNFDISNGKMPKLGSLEYLLKASNIFKAGLTGLSINGIIDLITPLKTGEFSSISGDINITNGIANDINIYSSGNDLNMYMTGSYNIDTAVADMKIFGSLTKNITTVFGKIKNASLNTLFNTIPGVNNSDEKILMQTEISKIPNIKDATDIYRIFAVDINGDINGENYVKSFKWVK